MKRVNPTKILIHICIGTRCGVINEDNKYPGAIGNGIILRIIIINVGAADLKNKIKKNLIELNAHWIKNMLAITIII